MVHVIGTELNFFVIPGPHLTDAALSSAFTTCQLEDNKSLSRIICPYVVRRSFLPSWRTFPTADQKTRKQSFPHL